MTMLPDFQGLRQQPRDRTDHQSLKLRSNKPSSESRSFHQGSDGGDGKAFQGNRAPKSEPKKTATKAFTYVPEALDDFLAIWNHRYDFIYAPHPDPGQKPDWQTESKYPLSDRLITQGASLYGVRPGATTAYALLDLDYGSPYHPRRDPLALQRICDALEPLGLLAHLTLTSSDSKGLHLYFPCAEPMPSWQLALAVSTLLENAGFKIMSGWLEVFPNRKPFATDGSISLYNGHRLPLQQGSYLLNDELHPIASSQLAFVRYWQQAANRNDISVPVLEQTIRQSQRRTYRITGKAEKFLNDLDAEIELGWTGRGQTNHLLGRIAMRSYIFGHTLYAAEPLKGKALADDIVRVARALPGFSTYCGHQLDIERKARHWARKIEKNSHYFPYATRKATKLKDGPSWNQQQQQGARDRIQATVLELFRQDNWPSGITARFNLLRAGGLSGKTLYRHQDLWHPTFIRLALDFEPVEIPPDPPVLQTEGWNDCARGASIPPSRTSLLRPVGWNRPDSKGYSSLGEVKNDADLEAGWNDSLATTPQPALTSEGSAPPVRTTPPRQLVLDIQSALLAAQAAQRAKAEASQHWQQLNGHKQATAEHIARLQGWVDSGDPILMAEARQQLDRIENSS
jgi:hypothetical protein